MVVASARWLLRGHCCDCLQTRLCEQGSRSPPVGGVAGLGGSLCLSFLRSRQTDFQSGCIAFTAAVRFRVPASGAGPAVAAFVTVGGVISLQF